VDGHRPALALAHRRPGRAPAPVPPPAEAGIAQHAPDREGAHGRQPVGCLAEGAPERGERPGCGAVPLPIGRAAYLAEDALLLGRRVPLGRAAPVAGLQAIQPASVEARDQERDAVAAAPPGCSRRLGEAVPVGDGQQRLGPRDDRRRLGVRPAQAKKLRPLPGGGGTKWIFLTT
jgi:hypothetical protein